MDIRRQAELRRRLDDAEESESDDGDWLSDNETTPTPLKAEVSPPTKLNEKPKTPGSQEDKVIALRRERERQDKLEREAEEQRALERERKAEEERQRKEAEKVAREEEARSREAAQKAAAQERFEEIQRQREEAAERKRQDEEAKRRQEELAASRALEAEKAKMEEIRQREAEEARERERQEAEKLKLQAQQKAENKRLEQEAEDNRRRAEEERKRQEEAAETQRLKDEAEKAQAEKEEAERIRVEQEAEKKRIEEQTKAAEQEALRKQKEIEDEAARQAEAEIQQIEAAAVSGEKLFKAEFPFEAQQEEDLAFEEGDTIALLEELDDNWWKGRHIESGRVGVFPKSYVTAAPGKTSDVQEQSLQTEQASTTEPERLKSKESESIGVYVAQYDFEGTEEGDLGFQTGDEIIATAKIDDDWFRGRIGDREGLFPSAYVILKDDDEGVGEPEIASSTEFESYVAAFDYESEEAGDLTFVVGEVVTVLEKIDDGWWRGSIGDREGLFPSTFVQPQ